MGPEYNLTTEQDQEQLWSNWLKENLVEFGTTKDIDLGRVCWLAAMRVAAGEIKRQRQQYNALVTKYEEFRTGGRIHDTFG